MKTTIGKYKVTEDGQNLKISYIYTLSDLIGSFWYLLMVLVGPFFMYVSYSLFATGSIYTMGAWITGLGGTWLFLFGAYILILGTSDLYTNALQIDKQKRVIIIGGFLRSETVRFEECHRVFYKITDKGRYTGRFKYATLCLKLNDGSERECFVIRSSIAIDIGRKVDKDLYTVSGKLKDVIAKFISAK